MTQKLAFYFLGQDGASRVLDAEFQPAHGAVQGWTVGRLPSCDIVFSPTRSGDYSAVSKAHALISATPSQDTTECGTPIYHWELVDVGNKGRGSTNGTYLARDNQMPYRIQPGVAYAIKEGDRVQFGCRAAMVKLSFDVDETSSLEDDGPPTGSGQSKPSKGRKGGDSPWFVPDILEPVWVWFTAKGSVEQFVFLLAIGGFAVLLLYVWRM